MHLTSRIRLRRRCLVFFCFAPIRSDSINLSNSSRWGAARPGQTESVQLLCKDVKVNISLSRKITPQHLVSGSAMRVTIIISKQQKYHRQQLHQQILFPIRNLFSLLLFLLRRGRGRRRRRRLGFRCRLGFLAIDTHCFPCSFCDIICKLLVMFSGSGLYSRLM